MISASTNRDMYLTTLFLEIAGGKKFNMFRQLQNTKVKIKNEKKNTVLIVLQSKRVFIIVQQNKVMYINVAITI